MVIVKVSGGLGNQLFQYAIGCAISNRLSCELLLDTSFYPKQSLRKYELDKFNIKAKVATQKEVFSCGGGDDLLSRFLRKLNLSSLFFPNYIKEKESLVYLAEISHCKSGSFLDGYWQNPQYFSDIKDELVKQIVPIMPLSSPALEWQNIIINTKNCVSLHVRRGDYVNNAHTNSVHGVCDLSYYREAITNIHETVEKPKFFVFSDDISWCKDNLGSLGHFTYVDNTLSAIDDLMLMSFCEHHIIANSTFSWWGAWLNDHGITIAPKRWFSSVERNNKDLFPEKW
ncbi:TPA: alpha-1,2-fucosyltransferase, partial [Vibrio parahaemolyticus]